MSSFLFRGFFGCLGSVTPASSAFLGDFDLFRLSGDLLLLRFSGALDLLRFSGDFDLLRFSFGDLDLDLRERSGDFSAFKTGGFFRLSGDLERDLRDFLRSSSLEDELLELEELLDRVFPSPISRQIHQKTEFEIYFILWS